MTDTPRCEPREELRGADGWHWLDGDRPIVARWYAARDYAGECWRINATQYSGEGAHKRGYRYIAPITPAAEVDALRAEIGRLAPLIAAQERERSAVIAETHEWFVGGIGSKAPGSGQARAIAAAIRAMPDDEVTK